MKNSCYEGKYFENRDFYDWGIDYEFYRLFEELKRNLDGVDLIIKPLENNIGTVNVNELNLREKEIFDDLLENTKKTKNKMFIIYLYTIFDGFCTEFFKAIAMYDKTFISEQEVKISYKDIDETDNKTDLIEIIVDELLNSNFGNIMNKLQKIYEYLDIDFEDINEKIYIFSVERNCLVHNNGIYSKKALKRIRKSYKDRFEKQKEVNLQDGAIEEYKALIEKIINEIEEKVQKDIAPENLYHDSIDIKDCKEKLKELD